MLEFKKNENEQMRLAGRLKSALKKHWKIIVLFIAFEAVFTALTAPFFIFFGPFENLKNVAVGSIYTTFSHRYMVDTFLSQQAIERIMGKEGYYGSTAAVPPADETEPVQEVEIPTIRTDKLDFVQIDGSNLKGYMVIIHDPTKVKVGYSSKIPHEGESTSSIAKRNKALAAINAGGFSYDEAWTSTGGRFEGYIIHQGEIIGNANADNDVVDDAVGFTEKGELIFGRYSANELLKNGVKEAITFFGPQLIVKGRKVFSNGETGGFGINPRTAIGQKATGEVVFIVIDGRNIFGSLGATMYDLQEILFDQGVVNAIALDGGSSSTMFFNGKVVNKPSNPMGERAIPSVFMMIPESGGSK